MIHHFNQNDYNLYKAWLKVSARTRQEKAMPYDIWRERVERHLSRQARADILATARAKSIAEKRAGEAKSKKILAGMAKEKAERHKKHMGFFHSITHSVGKFLHNSAKDVGKAAHNTVKESGRVIHKLGKNVGHNLTRLRVDAEKDLKGLYTGLTHHFGTDIARAGEIAADIVAEIFAPASLKMTASQDLIKQLNDITKHHYKKEFQIASQLLPTLMGEYNGKMFDYKDLYNSILNNLNNNILKKPSEWGEIGQEVLKGQWGAVLNTLENQLGLPKATAQNYEGIEFALLQTAKIQSDSLQNTFIEQFLPQSFSNQQQLTDYKADKTQTLLDKNFLQADTFAPTGLDNPAKKDDVENLLASMTHCREGKGTLLCRIWTMALDILSLGNFLLAYLEPKKREYNYIANSETPNMLLPVASALQAWVKQEIDDDVLEQELVNQGYNKDRIEVLKNISRYLPSVEDAIDLAYRGIIKPEDRDLIMLQHGMSTEQVEAYVLQSEQLLNITYIRDLYIRDLISIDQVKEYLTKLHFAKYEQEKIIELFIKPTSPNISINADGLKQALANGFLPEILANSIPNDYLEQAKANGIAEADVLNNWLLHFNLLDINTILTCYYRGYIDQTYLDNYLTAQNIPVSMQSLLLKAKQPLIPYFQLIEVMTSGVLTEDETVSLLKEYGFTDDSIKATLKYIQYKIAESKTKHIEKTGLVTLSQLESLYIQSKLNKEDLTKYLEDEGYNDKQISDLIKYLDIKQTIYNKTQYIKHAKQMFINGHWDETQVKTYLYNNGIDTLQIDNLLLELEHYTKQHIKPVSESLLEKMYKKNIIDHGTALQGLLNLGYSQEWANNIIALWQA